MSKLWLTAVLVVVFGPWAAPAQEYAIKVKRPGLGDKSQVKTGGTFDVEFKLVDDVGNAVIDAKESKVTKFQFHDVGLERSAAGDELVRVKRKYDHAERRVKDVRQTLPYQGKVVLIEKKDGAFRFDIEGEERLEGKDAEELNEEFNKGGLRKLVSDPFLPRKAVKVNDKWTVDVEPLAKSFGGDGKIAIDAAKATGSGKLLKAYQKNGKQFGVIELTLEFPVMQFVGDDGTKYATKNSKITMQLEADCAIDGTLDDFALKGSLAGDVRAEGVNVNGMTLNLVITLRASTEETWTPVAK
jgi:hypothetical protein